MDPHRSAVSAEHIEEMIYWVRGHRVILAADLAALYGVVTRRLNEQVKRNRDRFPDDFVFQLTLQETRALTSQFAISNRGRGGRRVLPFAFTEHGAIMAAMVLNSPRAVAMSVQVVRVFVRLRALLASNTVLAHKLAELERQLEGHDHAIRDLFETVRQLLDPPSSPLRRQIGFQAGEGRGRYLVESAQP